ncbi:hypothetical protein AB0M94_34865 [Streptomyces xanthochromogenes]|uniref:hypothetical protein n=1 Tax=Streptomyces xanthochromogenes TaxID=67384 RepID=UPI0034494D6B
MEVRTAQAVFRPRARVASRLAFLTLAAAMLAAGTGCSSSEKSDKDAKASLTPSPSASSSAPVDPAEAAKTAAVGTYKAYWQEMEKLYATPTGAGADMSKYAASAALKNAQADSKQTHDKGLIATGQVRVDSTTVTSVDVNRQVPNARLSSCLDVSRWQVVDATTKQPAALPSTRLTRYVIVSTVERWSEGWRVIKDEPQAGRPC